MALGEKKLEKIFEKNNKILKKEISIELDKKLDDRFKAHSIEFDKKLDDRFKAYSIEFDEKSDKRLKANNVILRREIKLAVVQGIEELVVPVIEKILLKLEEHNEHFDEIEGIKGKQNAEIDRNDKQDKRLDAIESKI